MKEARKKVGRYHLGIRDVDLYLRSGHGGDFESASEKNGIAEINIGASPRRWADVVSVLVHESAEMVLSDLHRRYRHSTDYADDHASYLFVINHSEFAEAMGRVGWFLSAALPNLAAAYKKNRKRRPRP